MNIKVDLLNIDKAISEIEEYKKNFDENVTKFVGKVVEVGEEQATMGFRNAQYDGTNDVRVRSRSWKKSGTVTARGSTVLFIEFGTGIYYGNAHPEAYEFGYFPGSYGPNGLKDYWFYKGSPGTNGAPSESRPGSIITHGNPANMCMYNAGKAMETQAPRIAREVFK